MNVRLTLVHTVTTFDRKQADKAARSPRAYHNAYALSHYLKRVDDIVADIEAGATLIDAICAGFTPGPLRNACLKAFKFGKSAAVMMPQDSSGSYKGMPVYRPVSSR